MGSRRDATDDRARVSRIRMLGEQAASTRVHRVSIGLLTIGIGTTLAIAGAAQIIRDNNNERLLDQRAHAVGAVASGSVGGVQTPLISAALLAEASDGAAAPFQELMMPIVQAGRPFVSASLWSLDGATPTPVVTVGASPTLTQESATRVREFFSGVTRRTTMSVREQLSAPDRRLGYAYSVGPSARYAVYAEARLPKDRRATIDEDSAFADLGYAIYLGKLEDDRFLLASSSGHGIPSGDERATTVIPFGDTTLFVAVTPLVELGGDLLAALPWIFLALGLAVTVTGVLLTERMMRGRERAETLAARLEEVADQNMVLYTAQRDVAQTLQRSLMPQELPRLRGIEAAARYEASVEGTEVGGDWYDALPVGGTRLLFSVGDVSGRGLEAAATMAALRYSIRAYALEGDNPAAILDKLNTLMSNGRGDQFATVVCGVIDTIAATITVARAGHLDMLVVEPSSTGYFGAPVGPPIGVDAMHDYQEATDDLADIVTFVAFTDGLVERRDENLDVGLERLRASATPDTTIQVLVDSVVDDLAPHGADDVAVLGLRWTRPVRRTRSAQSPRTLTVPNLP